MSELPKRNSKRSYPFIRSRLQRVISVAVKLSSLRDGLTQEVLAGSMIKCSSRARLDGRWNHSSTTAITWCSERSQPEPVKARQYSFSIGALVIQTQAAHTQ